MHSNRMPERADVNQLSVLLDVTVVEFFPAQEGGSVLQTGCRSLIELSDEPDYETMGPVGRIFQNLPSDRTSAELNLHFTK